MRSVVYASILSLIFLSAAPARANTSPPPIIACKRVEVPGKPGADQAHQLDLQYVGQTEEGGYIYSAPSGSDANDDGINAVYDPATGALADSDESILCPPKLVP